MIGMDRLTWVKQLAKDRGCAVQDPLVLARGNDPYYIGTPAHRALAEWFAGIWGHYGYTSGAHIRRVHYRLVNDDPPAVLPDGKVYVNDEKCWAKLALASKYARYLGLVAIEDFEDRRNPPPILNANGDEHDPGISVETNTWSLMEIPPCPEPPEYELSDFEGEQAHHLEIWVEKSTMNDVLEPLCRRYGANLVYSLGEQSVTAAWRMAKRVQADGRPTRVFYISDFDPAGQSMPVAASRKLQFCLSELDITADVRLFHLALTAEQCEQYRLPRAPIKDAKDGASEIGRAIWNGRKRAFEDRYGVGATELDAIEGLHEGTLAAIGEDALSRYHDPQLDWAVRDVRVALEDAMSAARAEVLEEHDEELGALDAEHAQLVEEFGGRMRDLGRRYRELFGEIEEELEEAMPNVSEFPVPEPAEAEEWGEALFASRRDYMEQLEHYKRFQGRLEEVRV